MAEHCHRVENLVTIGFIHEGLSKIFIGNQIVLGTQKCLTKDTGKSHSGMMLGESVQRVEPGTKETVGHVCLRGWNKHAMHGTVLDQLRVVNQQVATCSGSRELGEVVIKRLDILGIKGNRKELGQKKFMIDVWQIEGHRMVENQSKICAS